jgi:hypothetical protein
MKIPWERFGAKLGVGFALAGFVFVFLGWNGAASTDRVPSQFPYLISGGLVGLCLVVIGAALIVAETGREDRDRLRAEIEELRAAIGGLGGASTNGGSPSTRGRGSFVAGETTYHLPSCRLLEGRGDLPRVTREEVSHRGLVACRVCEPAGAQQRRRTRTR